MSLKDGAWGERETSHQREWRERSRCQPAHASCSTASPVTPGLTKTKTVYLSPHEHWAVPGEPGCQHSWLHRGWLPPVGYNRGNKAEEYRESSQPH